MTRLEVLAGMRARQEDATRALLRAFVWHPVDDSIAEIAGQLGRRWLPGNRDIDSTDLAIAATTITLDAQVVHSQHQTLPNVRGAIRTLLTRRFQAIESSSTVTGAGGSAVPVLADIERPEVLRT